MLGDEDDHRGLTERRRPAVIRGVGSGFGFALLQSSFVTDRRVYDGAQTSAPLEA